MLNEKKVKIMTRLAIYEKNIGEEDLRINEYFKNDYVSMNNLMTRLGVTLVCLVIFGIHLGLKIFDIFIEPDFEQQLLSLGVNYLIIYIVVIVLFTVISTIIYTKKYKAAQVRLKGYNKVLDILDASEKDESGR